MPPNLNSHQQSHTGEKHLKCDFCKKDFETSDVRASIIAAISIRIQNPIFESQTKTKLGSTDIDTNGITIRVFINDFVKTSLDNFLHKNTTIADQLLSRILLSEP